MVRCFIAVNLPDEIRDGVVGVQKRVMVPGVKAVEPSCLHVTMYFLGEVEQSSVDGITDELGEVKDAPRPVSVKGAGAFPRINNPRVIWIRTHGELEPLHSGIENAIAARGFKPDKRFHPHITIGRVKRIDSAGREELAKRIDGQKDAMVGSFVVKSFELMKSTLTPKGPIYEVLKRFPLHGDSHEKR